MLKLQRRRQRASMKLAFSVWQPNILSVPTADD
jgi:hypothetical protein